MQGEEGTQDMGQERRGMEMCLFYKVAGAKKEEQGTYSVGEGGV